MLDSTFRIRVPAQFRNPTGPAAPSAWQAADWQAPACASRRLKAALPLAALAAALWGAAATAYLVLRDGPAFDSVEQRLAMPSADDGRLSRPRPEAGAVRARRMPEKETFDAGLEALRRRQALIERRASELAGLIDAAGHPALRTIIGRAASEATGSVGARRGERRREIRLAFPARGAAARPATERPAARNPAMRALTRLALSQDRLEAAQQATLDGLEAGAVALATRIEDAVAGLGFDLKALAPQPISSAPAIAAAASLGGPFVPTPLAGTDARLSFERQVGRVRARIARSVALYDGLLALPLRGPLGGQRDVTSGFGPRHDPFLGSMASHEGIDLRASRGTEVRATADGLVTIAGPNAGYGNLVEIEHKNSVSTRYAHLSAIAVSQGQSVKAGDIIGLVGSTGRSTGAHLHYETRIDGEPIDPGRFLLAGERFAAAIASD